MLARYERFSHLIGEIQKHLNKIYSEQMEKYGLQGAQARYLVILSRYTGGITSSRLATVCDRNKADVSRATSALESKGLLKKLEGNGNYRARLVLTEEGQKIAEVLTNLAISAVSFAGKDIPEEYRESFYSALETVEKNLEILSKNGIPEDGLTQDTQRR